MNYRLKNKTSTNNYLMTFPQCTQLKNSKVIMTHHIIFIESHENEEYNERLDKYMNRLNNRQKGLPILEDEVFNQHKQNIINDDKP
jgi:hypothetical protein